MRGAWRSRVANWWRTVLDRQPFEQGMEEELRFHLESHAADLIAQGVAPAEAHRRARVALGLSPAAIEEHCRESYGLRWWDDLCADLRYALRQFRHAPGFTATVIVVLALGIGANAAMFTVIGRTLLRRLPYGHGDQLVTLNAADKSGGALSWTAQSDVAQWVKARSIAELLPFQQGHSWLKSSASMTDTASIQVGSNFCGFLQVAPALGRCFTAADATTKNAVLILSDALWRNAFSSDPHVIGTSVMLDKTSFVVVGVMPPGFRFPVDQPILPQVWAPLALNTTPGADDSAEAMARLKPGISLEQAHADLSSIQYGLAKQRIDKTALNVAQTQVLVRNYRESLSSEARPAMLAMLAAVLTLWLIACINVANLLLARGVARQRELAIRNALGAGRWRIVRQLLLESLLLSVAGSLAGIALAISALYAFGHLLQQRLQLSATPLPDLRVLGALLGLSLLSALAFGLVPAMIASRVNGERALRQHAATATGRSHSRLQPALVACEVACTVVLLIGCGLLLRTVFALRKVPLGFRTDNVSLIHPVFPDYRYKDDADMQQLLYGPLLDRIRTIHGVESVSLTTIALLDKQFDMSLMMYLGDKDDGPMTQRAEMRLHADGRELQKVLGFGMREGRFFNQQDTRTSQPVAVVNQAFVDMWKKTGKSVYEFKLTLDKDRKRNLRIVGVMDDMRQVSVNQSAAPEMDLCAEQLLPTDQFYGPTMRAFAQLAIRSSVPVTQIEPDIRSAMAAVDPAMKGTVVETMQQVVNDNIGDQLFAAHLLETFGGCALLVAMTGLYGFLAYLISQRTHEIGVRLALGAQRFAIQRMFLVRAVGMIGAGLLAGLVLSLFTTGIVRRFLYGVRPNDTVTLATVVMLILSVGLLAAWLPARRASRVEPVEALREA